MSIEKFKVTNSRWPDGSGIHDRIGAGSSNEQDYGF